MTRSASSDPQARRAAATDWCMKLGDSDAALEDRIAFELWLDEHPDNRETFRKVAALWLGTAQAADLPELISVRADALEAMRSANQRRWSRLAGKGWRAPLALAASLLLLCSYVLLHDPVDHYATGIGERRVVRLSDGSRISLDAATRVDVRFDNDSRELRLLAGRAKFDVAKDARRPFSVAAAGKMVVATGTAFSVELLQRQMRVILYEGRVAVIEDGPADQPPRPVLLAASKPAPADQLLTPGRELVASRAAPQAQVVETDLARSLAWEGGQLTFTDEPLDLAVERVNRYADKKIRLADAKLARLHISGAFNAGDTAGFVDGISTLFPLRVREDETSIVLMTK